MEVRIAELERRNAELEDQLNRGSDPLELRLQQLTEESTLLQNKLRVTTVQFGDLYNSLFSQREYS